MAGILSVLLAGKAAAGGGPTTYDGFAATRGRMPTHIAGLTNVNTRSGHYARTDISQLKILCPNYYESEIGPGGATTITASVEYPAGTLTQILFSGSASGTIPNGGTLISDYITPTFPIPNGERFWIRTHQVNSSGVVYTGSTDADAKDLFMGDCYEISATDRTMSGVVPPVETIASYAPAVIAPMTAPSVLMLGASIITGVTDVLDMSGDLGIVARTIGPSFGYFSPSMPGETAARFVAAHTERMKALPFCTYVYCDYGYNDYLPGDSAATVKGNLTTIYGYFSTKTINQLTQCPRSTSTDSWATTANQTVVANYGPGSARDTVNIDLRSTAFGPPGGFSDVGSVCEYSPPSGLYLANKTIDGIHPNNSGYLDIAATGFINKTLVGTPAAPATETGSGWLDHGADITISTWRRTNDTATRASTSGNTTVRGAGGNSSGRKYFELEILQAHSDSSSGIIVGLINGTTSPAAGGLDTYLGNIDDSFGLVSGAGYAFVSLTIFTAISPGTVDTLVGNVLGFAADFTNKFFYLRCNGVWLNGGVPTSGATGTGHVASWTGTPTLYPGLTFTGGIDIVRLRTANFLYAPPTGSGNDYTAWG